MSIPRLSLPLSLGLGFLSCSGFITEPHQVAGESSTAPWRHLAQCPAHEPTSGGETAREPGPLRGAPPGALQRREEGFSAGAEPEWPGEGLPLGQRAAGWAGARRAALQQDPLGGSTPAPLGSLGAIPKARTLGPGGSFRSRSSQRKTLRKGPSPGSG